MNIDEFRKSIAEATSSPLGEHGVPGLPTDPNEARDFLRNLDREMAERLGDSMCDVLKESGNRFARNLLDGSHHD